MFGSAWFGAGTSHHNKAIGIDRAGKNILVPRPSDLLAEPRSYAGMILARLEKVWVREWGEKQLQGLSIHRLSKHKRNRIFLLLCNVFFTMSLHCVRNV